MFKLSVDIIVHYHTTHACKAMYEFSMNDVCLLAVGVSVLPSPLFLSHLSYVLVPSSKSWWNLWDTPVFTLVKIWSWYRAWTRASRGPVCQCNIESRQVSRSAQRPTDNHAQSHNSVMMDVVGGAGGRPHYGDLTIFVQWALGDKWDFHWARY